MSDVHVHDLGPAVQYLVGTHPVAIDQCVEYGIVIEPLGVVGDQYGVSVMSGHDVRTKLGRYVASLEDSLPVTATVLAR